MRSADTYRGARRNECRAARGFTEWCLTVAHNANVGANIAGRVNQANAAREAAAKAVVGNPSGRSQIVAGEAMLAFYRGEKRTRAVSRIIRSLEKQVRAA